VSKDDDETSEETLDEKIARGATGRAAKDEERKYSRYRSRFHAALRYGAQRGLLKSVAWRTVRVSIIGLEHTEKLPDNFIIVANHSSHLDAPLILGSLPADKARYVATGAAADYFYDVAWRRGLTALFFNSFPVDRSGANPRSVSPKQLLLRGVPILVFPEGTRSKTGKAGKFKPGSAALSTSTSSPILPVAIIGAFETYPRGQRWPKAGRLPVGVVYGEAMRAKDGEAPVEFMDRVRAEILRLYDEHRESVLNPKAEGDHP